MANWYFYDENNKKFGPVDSHSLKMIAANGMINANTIIETETGIKSTAGKIKGLEFQVVKPKTATSEEPFQASTVSVKRTSQTVPTDAHQHQEQQGVSSADTAKKLVAFIVLIVFCIVAFIIASNNADSQSGQSGSGGVYVNGYFKKDGTYVRPHTRSK